METAQAAKPSTESEQAAQNAALLATYKNRVRVQGKWFSRSNVSLDGYEFESCRFDNCTIIIETGDFIMRNCFVAENNRVLMAHGARKAVSLLIYRLGQNNAVLKTILSGLEGLHPKIKQDGTISVEDL